MLNKLWSLLLVLIASSLMTTATVHAREIPGLVAIECSGAVHQDGDSDQSQGDADQAVPHHHGTCHGQALSMPTSSLVASASRLSGLRPLPDVDAAMPSRLIDPALRPPTA